MQADSRFHQFAPEDLADTSLPKQFTYPFHYTPHPLCKLASDRLMSYIEWRIEWREELQSGKMMGVLVVAKGDDVGYLAAYSGNLGHTYCHDYFVPAVCDLLSDDSFFASEERIISNLNQLIDQALSSDLRIRDIEEIDKCRAEAQAEIEAYRRLMAESKAMRDKKRSEGMNEAELVAESQHQKAQLRRIKKGWEQRIEALRNPLVEIDEQIERWKRERQQRSVALQRLVFERFEMLNANGLRRNLNEIFATTPLGYPPSGAGECAAPKLLQYAYANGYRPLAMAEFWVGRSPREEVRHHGHFYPSCKAKCEPILGWMLQGLDVEPNPLLSSVDTPLNIIYEDRWIVAVNKPEGLLSVPGKLTTDSLLQRVQRLYEGEEIYIAHRLDMATSGIVLFARSMEVYHHLQAAFKSHDISKCYMAILDGKVNDDSGSIDLPLILNPDDRPRQMVSHAYGKPALTKYEVVKRHDGRTWVKFYPITGRTHQLRVHAAHCDGLNAPILGDTLYGTADKRLYLHACSITFRHPHLKRQITIDCPAPF